MLHSPFERVVFIDISPVKVFIEPTVVLVPTRVDDALLDQLDPELRARGTTAESSKRTEKQNRLPLKLTNMIQEPLTISFVFRTILKSVLRTNSPTTRHGISLSAFKLTTESVPA